MTVDRPLIVVVAIIALQFPYTLTMVDIADPFLELVYDDATLMNDFMDKNRLVRKSDDNTVSIINCLVDRIRSIDSENLESLVSDDIAFSQALSKQELSDFDRRLEEAVLRRTTKDPVIVELPVPNRFNRMTTRAGIIA